MSLSVPSTSKEGGDVPHSWALVIELAWLNVQLAKQKSRVSVTTVALLPCKGHPNHADFVVVYEVGGALLIEYLVPVKRSKMTNKMEWHKIMKDVLRDINQNVRFFLPALRTLQRICPDHQQCDIHFDWDESGKLKVFVLVEPRDTFPAGVAVKKEFTYDRQAFVNAYKLNRLEDPLFEQIVYFVGDGAKVAWKEAYKPMSCKCSRGPPRGTKRVYTHHGDIKKPKKARNSVDV